MSLTPEEFDYVRDLVHRTSAIALDDGKEYLVQSRLAPIARREGLDSVSDLISRLPGGAPRLREDIVEAMATKETSFFRDGHPFDALRDVIVPDLFGSRPRTLRFWSAAAATGQEAYSLALLMREDFPHAPDPAILATDLSAEALAVARAGRYTGLEVNRGLPARMLVKHFDRDGLHWKLDERIRRMVDFRQLNLARPWPLVPMMDVVLLRNVLIYFDAPSKAAVLDRVARVLRPGGYLIVGGAETTYGIDDRYKRVTAGRTLCYRLISGNGAAS